MSSQGPQTRKGFQGGRIISREAQIEQQTHRVKSGTPHGVWTMADSLVDKGAHCPVNTMRPEDGTRGRRRRATSRASLTEDLLHP